MPKLFEVTSIKSMQLANRFVRSATWEGMAGDDGSVTPALIACMDQLAEGQVGLIISGHAYISPEGQAGPKQLGIYKDDLIDGLKQMTQAVHRQGGKIVLQMAHSGCMANPKLTGLMPLGPSNAEEITKSPCKEMTIGDIQEFIGAFGLAAQRAKEAGFDGVQLHSAHGYLLNQFISPLFNKRTDAYGGSVENRYRVLKEVFKKVRATVGKNFPVLIKLNSQDYLEGGLELEDSLRIGRWLEEDGIDAIELSGGTVISGKNSPARAGISREEKEAYFLEAAQVFKQTLKVPLILVGGNRSFPVAERIIDQGFADYISMCRSFIREPGLIKRWQSGDRRKAFCLSDNQCFGPAMAGEGIYCVVDRKEKNMSQKVYRQLLEVMKKRGGAYAGMDIPEFFNFVEELFTPHEAEVNNAMPKGFFTAKTLAATMGRDEKEIEATLEAMADKGLCLALDTDQGRVYQAARFMPGILEFQFMPGKTTDRDKKIAQLIYAYKKAFDQKTDRTVMTFPTSRVITVDALVKVDNQVHTYDQVQTFIDQSDPIAVTTCYCRHAAVLRGEDIHGMPNEVCMQFGPWAQFAIDRLGGRKVSKQEAREVLNLAEEAGLIHMSLNMTEGISFLCNCDRWHCSAVQNVLAKPKPGLFFNSGFEPQFDPNLCSACGTCIDRCPPEALILGDDGLPQVDLDRCFGCAVCATGCPSQAISMVNKPGFPPPPKDAKAFREAVKASQI